MLATADEPQTERPPEQHSAGVPAAIKDSVPLAEALVLLRIDRSTLYRYAAQVDCPLVIFVHGRRAYVPKASIDEYEQYLIDQARNKKSTRARRKRK